MVNKKYFISDYEIIKIIDSKIGCIASDLITVSGEKCKYMYREEPINKFDSGWRFFSGNETQEYTDDANNFSFYKINTILNYDIDVIKFIEMPIGTELERMDSNDKFTIIK
jgi:hypothetical protein